ncbi:LysR substrate-binding domain-containing protein [Legionella oakridgensis]|uniref:LysR substrate-binding domain-containing protein n=1 Tax=Legionella oakridgensis TaxID=29423 RepID=UPI0003DE4C04|nr:LysR substrate-binding domain-containing protein [Legionella oakridgensis]ETO94435.1 transcriptional regulator, LysR family [Legionella oakridgensis RV-2-2007]
MDLNDMYYFFTVVEHGSFTKASISLGINKSILSRRISKLEKNLQVKLLYRTTRSLSLTELGQAFYQHCQSIMQESEAAYRTILHVREKPSGRIRISCPTLFSQFQFGQYLIDFMHQYPEIQINLIATERFVDLNQEGIDVAIRFQTYPLTDSSLIAINLGPSEHILVTSPDYLKYNPPVITPQDLPQAKTLFKSRADGALQWSIKHQKTAQQLSITINPLIQSDEWLILKRSALAGLGVTVMPQKYCQPELDSGELIRLLPEWSVPTATLYLIYPSKLYMIPSVRHFIDFMSARLNKP